MEAQHSLSGQEISRYSRQISVESLGINGQEKLKRSKILVVGAGGLGSPALLYLAGAGIGKLGIMDGDEVDESNLHRQVLHDSSRKGVNKAESARQYLNSLNPLIDIQVYQEMLSQSNGHIVQEYDVIVDGSDNPKTKYLINDLAVLFGKPLVFACALRWEGHLSVFGIGPCYRCIFPIPPPASMRGNCSALGVIGPVPGVLGTLQALETIKVINDQSTYIGKMLIFDGLSGTFKTIQLRGKQENCVACSKQIDPFTFDYEEFLGDNCEVDEEFPLEFVIQPQQYKDNKENYAILDVRPRNQFELCRLPGSIHIPLQDLSQRLTEVQQDEKEILIICKRGITAKKAGKVLLDNNINNFKVLDGGLTAWHYHDSEFPLY